MAWARYINADGSPDEIGTDGGTIVADDEHEHGARITLEKDSAVAPFSITCGIYGWMVHTRFFASLEDAWQAFGAMKPELAQILDAIPAKTDPDVDHKIELVTAAMSDFVDRFP